MKRLLLAFGLILAVLAPVAAQTPAGPIGPVATPTATGSLIAAARPAKLYSLVVTTGASAGFVMLFDQTTVPADGTVTPAYCFSIPATTTLSGPWIYPASFGTGIVAVFSTTGCFSKTISATAFISAQVQ